MQLQAREGRSLGRGCKLGYISATRLITEGLPKSSPLERERDETKTDECSWMIVLSEVIIMEVFRVFRAGFVWRARGEFNGAHCEWMDDLLCVIFSLDD